MCMVWGRRPSTLQLPAVLLRYRNLSRRSTCRGDEGARRPVPGGMLSRRRQQKKLHCWLRLPQARPPQLMHTHTEGQGRGVMASLPAGCAGCVPPAAHVPVQWSFGDRTPPTPSPAPPPAGPGWKGVCVRAGGSRQSSWQPGGFTWWSRSLPLLPPPPGTRHPTPARTRPH